MSVTKDLLKELIEESVITRKMLERIPADKYDWRPHVKSMNITQLAGHIAELPGWVSMAFTMDGLDFAQHAYVAPVWNNREELMKIFEDALSGANTQLQLAADEQLNKQWILRNGSQILADLTTGGMARLALSQTIHHRAQLGVYLRLLDIPIPGTYGPSADDQGF